MDREKLLDRTRKDLRSVLISAPRGVPLRMLLQDFKMILGYELPFRQLGFQKYEEFIRTIPDVVKLAMGAMNEPTCFAVADANTRQIARFVALQKKPKLKKNNTPPSVKKPINPGFTKKSKFGPSSARPRGGAQGNIRRGGKTGHTVGLIGEPWPSHQHNKPNYYGKGSKASQYPPRVHGSQQQYKPPLLSPTFSSGSSTGFSAPSSTGFGGKPTVNSSTSASFNQGPRSNINSTVRHAPDKRVYSTQKTGSFSDPIKKCPTFTIKDISQKTKQNKPGTLPQILSVVGYIAGEKRLDYENQTTKYLLFNDYDEKSKRGISPAVMLFFYNTEMADIPVGSKLKVSGKFVTTMNRNKGVKEPAIMVQHYNHEAGATVVQKTRSGSSSSSRSVSPPIPAAPLGNLEELLRDLLKAKPSGVWGKRLGSEFKKMHGLEPPKDILEIAKGFSFVETETVTDTDVIVLLKEELPDTPKDAPQQSFSMPLQQTVASKEQQAIRQTVTFTTQKPSLPGTVEFTSELVNVYVIYIYNPISFYLQLTGEGYLDKLQAMNEAMSSYLSKHRVRPFSDVQVNGLYGYQWEWDGETDTWCRALVSSIAGKTATVYFPDYGNSEEVPVDDLMDLPKEFYQLPFQAVHCCLHGCSSLGEEATEMFVRHALDKNCMAQVMDSSGTRLSVELINLESDSNDTINSVIMSALHPVSTLNPQLPSPGEARVPVILTDVDEDGVVTVQLRGHGFNFLQLLMNQINEKYKKSVAADFVSTVTKGNVYCTQYPVDKKFYRVRVKDVEPPPLKSPSLQTVVVEYVDYGNEDKTEIKRLRRPLSDPLFSLPFQAVKCKLHGVPPHGSKWCEEAMATMTCYFDCEDLYLTVVEAGSGEELPSVTITVSAGGGEEDDQSLNDLVLQQDFGSKSFGGEYSSILAHSTSFDAGTSQLSYPSMSDKESLVSESSGIFTSSGRSLSAPNSAVCTTPLEFDCFPECDPHSIKDSFATSGNGDSSKMKKDTDNGTKFTSCNGGDGSLVSPSSAVALKPSSTPNLSPHSPSLSFSSTSNVNSSQGSLFQSLSNSQNPHSMSTSMSQLSIDCSAASTPLNSSTKLSQSIQSPRTPIDSPSSSNNCLSPSGTSDSSPCASPRYSGVVACGDGTVNGRSETLSSSGVQRRLSFASLSSITVEPVRVVSVQSPHNFVIQLLSQSELLDDLMNKLMIILSKPLACHLVPGSVKHGLVCCAQSSLDNYWYRALVVRSSDNLTVTVEFLDYGGTEVVKIEKLRSLPDEFFQFPFQGIQCTLRGVEPINREWSSDALNWFEKYVLDKCFFATELSKEGNRSCITLLNTSGQETVDVRTALKDAGFAEFQILLN